MLSLADDIRLCTIYRTGSDDRLGVGVMHQKEGKYHSLVISKDFNNGRSSKMARELRSMWPNAGKRFFS